MEMYKNMYYYVRNLIKYGKESEHLVYHSKLERYMLLKYNHVQLDYVIEFEDLIYNIKHEPKDVDTVLFNTPAITYQGRI